MTQTILLSVVGHTNTGKTSLIRTLLRNCGFGEVLDSAGTTRHVEAAHIMLAQQAMIELRDTPGLEDSLALAEHLAQLQQQGFHSRDCLQTCIEHATELPEFEQEIKVLKQSLQCDALLYVIDCREAVLEKYIEEIQILKLAARPILPVLNFIQVDTEQVQLWRDALAQQGLHALVSFDTVAFDFEAEYRLYQKLQTLLEQRYNDLQTLIDHRREQWQQLQQTCCQRAARCLLDCAQLRTTIARKPLAENGKPLAENGEPSAENGEPLANHNEPLAGQNKPSAQNQKQASANLHAVADLRDQARQLEQDCLQDLLELMQFTQDDIVLAELPVSNGEWRLDLFSAQTLKTLGLDTASAAATGAAIGAGVDLIFAGMSLGAATAAGAALGATWHNGKRFGKDLWQKLQGQQSLCLDDITLDALLLRQLWLLRTLFQRGHAAQQRADLPEKIKIPLPKDWPMQRKQLRALSYTEQPQIALNQLSKWLLRQLHLEPQSYSERP